MSGFVSKLFLWIRGSGQQWQALIIFSVVQTDMKLSLYLNVTKFSHSFMRWWQLLGTILRNTILPISEEEATNSRFWVPFGFWMTGFYVIFSIRAIPTLDWWCPYFEAFHIQFSITKGSSEKKVFWSTSNLLLKCGNTYEEEDSRVSQVQYVCLVHFKKFTRIQSSKLPRFPFLYLDFGIIWVIDNECI